MGSRRLSWRTCPKCRSKATKLFSLNTGLLTCQLCGHEYDPPKPKPKKEK
jgi:rubredoxin